MARKVEDAKRIAEAHFAGLAQTGLRKVCPRCGRGGWVFEGESGFVVVWDGPARAPAAFRKLGVALGPAKADTDAALTLRDLLLPQLGCGYDREGRP